MHIDDRAVLIEDCPFPYLPTVFSRGVGFLHPLLAKVPPEEGREKKAGRPRLACPALFRRNFHRYFFIIVFFISNSAASANPLAASALAIERAWSNAPCGFEWWWRAMVMSIFASPNSE